MVGPTGTVFGIDYDQSMIEGAERRAREAGLADVVKHQHADSAHLPFRSAQFDSCRSERLFQHLRAPEQTLSEMVRVTRPGGWIVVLDADWGTMSIDTREVETERRLARVHAERQLHNGYSGRQLHRLFKQQGLVEIEIHPFPLVTTDLAFMRQATVIDETERIARAEGVITEEKLNHWRAELKDADDRGLFFAVMLQLLAVGRKPS